jgi:hypothetical protein
MNIKFGIVAVLLLGSPTGANAALVFSDNFNTYDQQLNWTPPPSSWTVSSGTVDLIGETPTGTSFDFYPGNGGFVDLHGSTGQAGTLQTATTFAPGDYTLDFALGGNARGDVAKTTMISLGSFSRSITLASSDPLSLRSISFHTSGGNLSFADLPGGNGNIGNILDNVSLATASVGAVPEPATWAMMLLGFGGIGLMALRKRKNGFVLTA